MKDVNRASLSQEMQVVVFRIGSEEYCVEISTVREIIKKPQITHLPDCPAFVEGIISIRGSVIPVVDLREHFAATREKDVEEKIIIVDLKGSLTGLVVDEVTEVLRVASGTIEPPPQIVAGSKTNSFKGVVKLEQRLIILLDTERVLGGEISEALSDIATENVEVAQ